MCGNVLGYCVLLVLVAGLQSHLIKTNESDLGPDDQCGSNAKLCDSGDTCCPYVNGIEGTCCQTDEFQTGWGCCAFPNVSKYLASTNTVHLHICCGLDIPNSYSLLNNENYFLRLNAVITVIVVQRTSNALEIPTAPAL